MQKNKTIKIDLRTANPKEIEAVIQFLYKTIKTIRPKKKIRVKVKSSS